MKRYLCILFLLFGCFIFGRDYASASGVDRLVEAVYTGECDFSTAYAYNANCNITAISRGGMETEANGTRIDIDDLVLSYSGNQLTRITDSGEDSGEYGVMEFVDRAGRAAFLKIRVKYRSNIKQARQL